MMNILFVTPELYPVIKTGGLGDVSAALSDAFARLGHRVRVLMPGYPKAMALKNKRLIAHLPPLLGEDNIKLYHAKVPGNEAPLWLIDCPNLIDAKVVLIRMPMAKTGQTMICVLVYWATWPN